MTSSTADAVANAHAWFEVNSGWAPPDEETLAEWLADGVCRCPDECLVAPDAWCAHGLASWKLILAEISPSQPEVARRVVRARSAGKAGSPSPSSLGRQPKRPPDGGDSGRRRVEP